MCAFLQNARHLSAGQGNLFTSLRQRARSLYIYLSISGLENAVANSKILFYPIITTDFDGNLDKCDPQTFHYYPMKD